MMTHREQQLAAAEAAARRAGAFLREAFRGNKTVDESLAHDIKLRLDKETQALIVAELSEAYPGIAVLGEEGCCGPSGADERWIIDPIDGTVNYFYGLPLFCVCIALESCGRLVLGCVYDPMRDECYTALAGQQAFCNGHPIHVSARRAMAEAVIFVGHGTHDGSGEAGIRRFAYLSARVRKIRILGSAALSLCYIAAGRMDAYVESRISLWDFAAARVILEAAGGVLEFCPSVPGATSGAVTAWNGLLPLRETLAECSLCSTCAASVSPTEP